MAESKFGTRVSAFHRASIGGEHHVEDRARVAQIGLAQQRRKAFALQLADHLGEPAREHPARRTMFRSSAALCYAVGAEKERVAWAGPGGDLPEEHPPRFGSEVADGSTEKGDETRALTRDVAEVVLEVAHDCVDTDRRVLLR